jgi:uncharacterized repeat protein (TIGR01451 family)
MTWAAGAVALLGSHDAVSGASAGISGLVKYSGSTPVGSPTFDVAEPMGQPFRYRITVSNPGTDVAKNYFNCIPLPPGLTINTNLGGSGFISGTPMETGLYRVTLVAGNLNYPTPATAPATLTIYLPNAAPVFLVQPQDQSVLLGSNALFQAQLGGTPPLSYQWLRDGTNLPAATVTLLLLTNVHPADAGPYQLRVTNDFGSVTSTVARLTVREPLLGQLVMGGATVSNELFQFQVIGPVRTNYVIWGSTDFESWVPLQTNWVPDGLLRYSAPITKSAQARLYRASLAP